MNLGKQMDIAKYLRAGWRTGWLCLLALLPLSAASPPASQQELQAVMRLKPNAENGARLFTTCAACHGEDGGGLSDGTIPVIAGQHFPVLVRQIVGFRSDRTWEPRMTHFTDSSHLANAQAVADVADHVSRMPRPARAGKGLDMFVDVGARVYVDQCGRCHGTRSDDSQSQFILAGQHYAFLLHQMLEMADGRRPTFTPEHIQLMRQLRWPEITGVADYLSRQVPAAP